MEACAAGASITAGNQESFRALSVVLCKLAVCFGAREWGLAAAPQAMADSSAASPLHKMCCRTGPSGQQHCHVPVHAVCVGHCSVACHCVAPSATCGHSARVLSDACGLLLRGAFVCMCTMSAHNLQSGNIVLAPSCSVKYLCAGLLAHVAMFEAFICHPCATSIASVHLPCFRIP